MKINISFSPDEEMQAVKLKNQIIRLCPAMKAKETRGERYNHVYMEMRPSRAASAGNAGAIETPEKSFPAYARESVRNQPGSIHKQNIETPESSFFHGKNVIE